MAIALIELQDVVLLSECKRWISKHYEKDTLFLAKNINEAINMMQFSPIDLFLIELSSTPTEATGLESIAALSFYYPLLNIGLLIPAAFSNELNRKFKELTSFCFLNSPANLKEFIHLTEVLKVICHQAKPVAEMKIADYFMLVEIREKTCLLAIETEDKSKKGIVYFSKGVLYDAAYDHLKAESAMLKILSWKNIKITFKNLGFVDARKFRKQIQMSLTELIAEAAKSKRNTEADLLPTAEDDQPIEFLIETIAQSSIEAEEKAKAEAVKVKAGAMIKDKKIKAQAEAKAKAETEARLKAEAAAKIKAQAEAKAKAETEARLKAEAEAKAKAETEAKLKAETETKLKAETEAKLKAETETKLKAETETKLKAETEARLKAEAAAKTKAEAEARAMRFNKLALDEILKPLQAMDDYLAVGVFDMSANIFAKQGISTYDIEVISENAVALIKATLNTVADIGLGKCNFIQMNCKDSILEAVWELEEQFVVAMLLKSGAKNTGLAKISLTKVCDTIHEQLN